MSFYSVSKYVGPEPDDYKEVGIFTDIAGIVKLMTKASCYLYFIAQYKRNPEKHYNADLLGTINGEEFFNNPQMDFTFQE